MSQEQGNNNESNASVDTGSRAEESVKFINKEVLNPSVTPIEGTAKPLADQAAAMMIQDARTFLQGNEQVLTVAIAKATQMALNPTPNISKVGNEALQSLGTVLDKLTDFSTKVGTSAASISSEFGKKK